MAQGVTHDNKDVLFKVLSQNYKNKSFKALGLDLPKIERVLPTQLPSVSANEVRADNIFLLDDGRILIVDYESKVKESNFIKYLGYIHGVLAWYYKEDKKIYNITMAIIYTGDIKSATSQLDIGSARITIKQVFLSNFNSGEMYDSLNGKVEAGESLTDDDIIKFIILPLTESRPTKKQGLIEKTIDLAKKVADDESQLFIIAGILVAADKFIDKGYSSMVKEWIRLTKVARLFEEEKIEAVNQAREEDRINFAKEMLAGGEDIIKIMKYTKLSKKKILSIQSDLELSAAN